MATDSVHQQPDADAGLSFKDQRVTRPGANAIRSEDVVIEVDLVLGAVDGGEIES